MVSVSAPSPSLGLCWTGVSFGLEEVLMVSQVRGGYHDKETGESWRGSRDRGEIRNRW